MEKKSVQEIDSSIMPIGNNFENFLWLFNHIEKTLKYKLMKKPKLLFRASRDGFSAKAFHEKCDNKKPILILIESVYNKKFGGFANESFSSPKDLDWKYCDSAFLFSVDEKFISPVKNPNCAIGFRNDIGPAFGGGFDLVIDSDNSDSCTFYFGKSYTLPKGISYDTPESCSFLHGNPNHEPDFKMNDYEAWECISINKN